MYRIKVRNFGVCFPITLLDKYCPNQFEIVSFRKGDNGEDLIFSKKKKRKRATGLSSPCKTKKEGGRKKKEGMIKGKHT